MTSKWAPLLPQRLDDRRVRVGGDVGHGCNGQVATVS